MNSNNDDSYFKRGTSFYKKGDYKNAMVDFNEAISINQNNKEAHIFRSKIHFKDYNFIKALKDYFKTI